MTKKTFAIFLFLLFILTNTHGQVQISIDATQKSEPVSRHLFSKFTEHLGKNVYQGAWAQIVENPEFAPVYYWSGEEGNQRVMNELKKAEEIFQLNKLTGDAQDGIAAFWQSAGKIDGRLLKEGIRDFQQVKTSTEKAALQTGIFLPLHRTSGYELSLTARSDTPADICVQVLTTDLTPLGKVDVSVSPDWSTMEKKLVLSRETHKTGTPYILQIDLPAGSEVEISRILLFPDDHLEGWDPEVIQLMKEAHLPMLRFPGGNFVSGYDWRDGIGPIDQRPVLPNPAWPIMEWNHVGTDEWMTFCRLTGAEPMICINAGDGTPEEAADWVRYCNDQANTPMGKLRAENGHEAPYDVKIWEVGNELCGPWQIGYTDGEGYAKRYENFSKAMLKADPDIKLIANGLIRVLEKSQAIDRGDNEGWNEKLMQHNGDKVRSISVHSLVGGFLNTPADPVEVWKDLVAFAENYPEFLEDLVVNPMMEAGVEPKVAITELMDWPRHPQLGNVTSISGALWYSAILNVAIRSEGLIELITHSALLNHGGGLEKARGVVYTNPVYWANYLYSTQPGTIPLKVTADTPTFDSSGEFIIKKENMPEVDVVALMDEAGETCSVFLTNRSHDTPHDISLTLQGFQAGKEVEQIMIGSNDLALRNNWAEPERVKPESDSLKIRRGEVKCTIPPLTLVRLVLNKK